MNLDDDENFHNEEIFNADLYNLVAPIIAVFYQHRWSFGLLPLEVVETMVTAHF